MDTVFTIADPVKQKALKIPLVAHMTGISSQYSEDIKNSVGRFLSKMRIHEGEQIDFCQWSCFWAFDMTYFLIFGEYFGYMENGKDFNGIITAFIDIIRGASLLGLVPEYCSVLLGSNKVMSFLRKFQSFPDPTQTFLAVRSS